MGIAVNLAGLLDDAKCFELVRRTRWPQGVGCPKCGCGDVVRNGRGETQAERRCYLCNGCKVRFDDLSGTILSGHRQPPKTWVVSHCLMGLNLSNRQIAQELGLDESDVQAMTPQ